MSHHYSGPDFGFPHGDARLDLTDLYAFPKPSDADKSIIIMNVHPSAVVNPPGATTREPFGPEALYELKIDTNGDAVADIAYQVRFSSSDDGSQTATLRRVDGAQAGMGDSGQVIIEAAPVSTGRDARVTEAGGYRFFAGWRSDPFFFDTRGALNDLQFTGDDFFIDKDVCSIVLEMPNSALGPKRVRPMGAHAGRRGRGLGPGGPGRVTRASGLSRRLGERCLPRERARQRCPFRRCLRACAGACRWVYAGGSKAGGGNTAARHAVLRPHASRVFSEQWPYAHRRCRRRLPGSAHKREGDRGQGRAPHRSACRVPLFGAAAQHLRAEPCNFAYRARASQGVQALRLFMKEDVMNRLERVMYTAKAHTTGGRAGISRSSDGRLEVRLSRPGSPGTRHQPGAALAAGWSACFESAMEFAARNMRITLPADHAVDAEIDLGPDGGAFSLAARLYVSLPGMERATAQRLIEAAHQVCPYSRATHGNIAVETTLV
jgi:Ohr subfamily peroxiredoxin